MPGDSRRDAILGGQQALDGLQQVIDVKRLGHRLDSSEAVQARHAAIERRATVGKTLLLIQAMRSAGLEARPA